MDAKPFTVAVQAVQTLLHHVTQQAHALRNQTISWRVARPMARVLHCIGGKHNRAFLSD